jgi:hypothetical protein
MYDFFKDFDCQWEDLQTNTEKRPRSVDRGPPSLAQEDLVGRPWRIVSRRLLSPCIGGTALLPDQACHDCAALEGA